MKSGWEVTVRDTCPEGVLNALWEAGIPFAGVRRVDPITLHLCVPYSRLEELRSLLTVRGSEVCSCRPFGPRFTLTLLRRRTALLGCMLLCALLLGLSNLFVWRIDVVGNDTLPKSAVVRAMTAAGAGVGSFWPGFDPEQLRTRLLLALPELQWVGVSYRSGAVQVTVREQREPPKVVDNDAPTHVVSAADGVVTELSVKLGQPAVAEGDTVEKGQLLISGEAKSTLGTARAVHALGTVEARTWRTLTVRQPAFVTEKAYTGKKSRKISLILWGKPMKFYVGSSFSGGTCDKIILDYRLCVEDVFSLPVQIVVEQCVYRETRARQLPREAQEKQAQAALMETLTQLVGDGEIVTTDFAATARSNVLTMTVRAECREEIGEEVPMTAEELRQIQMQPGEETTND